MRAMRSILTRRIGAALVLAAAAIAGGCGGLGGGSFDPAQSCQAVGGSYFGGICHAGNG